MPILVAHKNKQTIVIAMTYLQMGGVERVMLNIVKGIDRNKFNIHILTTAPSSNPWHDKFQEHADCIVHINDIVDKNWPEYYRRRYVEEYITRNKADVLFITNSQTSYHAIPVIKKLNPNLRIYDLLHTHGTPQDKDAYLKISMPFDKYIDKRVVISEYLKNYYIEKYPVDPDKILVIYNGINIGSLKTAITTNKELIFTKIPKDRKIITYIGRLEIDKSPARLVEIAAELKKQNLPIALLVVGDGDQASSMIKKAEAANILNDYIFFYGNSNNPLPLAKQSDFTLLVSNAEGIPMSILESMSVSTPAIASAVGGIPEIIDDQQDGFLVPINNLPDEKSKILKFVEVISNACRINSDKYKKMQVAGRQKITARFSNMPKTYEYLFETGKQLADKKDKV